MRKSMLMPRLSLQSLSRSSSRTPKTQKKVKFDLSTERTERVETQETKITEIQLPLTERKQINEVKLPKKF